jgi:hypothetical protein
LKGVEVENRNQVLNELEKLTSQMDIPFSRLKDYNWLLRNAAINNPDSLKLKKVIMICQLLVKGDTQRMIIMKKKKFMIGLWIQI